MDDPTSRIGPADRVALARTNPPSTAAMRSVASCASMLTTDSRSAQLLLDGNFPLIECLRRRVEHRIRIGGLEDGGSDRTAERTACSLQCGDAHVDEGIDRLEWRRGTISERPNHLFNVVTAALHHGNGQFLLAAGEVVVDRASSSPGPLQDFRESGRRHPMVAVTDLGGIDHALTGVRSLAHLPLPTLS